MKDMDYQDRLWHLQQSHIERIRSIVNTHKAVAFFYDRLRTKDDILDILKHVEFRSTITKDVASSMTAIQRHAAIADFNRYAVSNESVVAPRLLMNVRSASGFRLYRSAAIVVVCRTDDLGRYDTYIHQAMARTASPGETADEVFQPSAYTIFYGDKHHA